MNELYRPTTRIATEYEFCSAHSLPFVPDTHKCKRVHGHNYKLVVGVEGSLIPQPQKFAGMVIDFFDLDEIVKPLVFKVDHFNLNDIPGLENPTAENIAYWFAARIKEKLDELPITVRVYETPECWAEVTL